MAGNLFISIISGRTPWITSSAVKGIRSLVIPLSKSENEPLKYYTVKLYFAELEAHKTGERIFDVKIQDKKVLDDFDILKETGSMDKEIVKVFDKIQAGSVIRVDLIPETGNTILSGIELKMTPETEN